MNLYWRCFLDISFWTGILLLILISMVRSCATSHTALQTMLCTSSTSGEVSLSVEAANICVVFVLKGEDFLFAHTDRGFAKTASVDLRVNYHLSNFARKLINIYDKLVYRWLL